MDRSLIVEIDHETWPPDPGPPAFPTAFHHGAATIDLNVPALLLLIGYLTTPSHAVACHLVNFGPGFDTYTRSHRALISA